MNIIMFMLLNFMLFQVNEISGSDYVGPFLNFLDAGLNNDRWNMSALVVAPDSIAADDCFLDIKSDNKNFEFDRVKPETIDTINGQQFFRYQLSVPRDNSHQRIIYQIGKGPAFSVYVPPKETDPHVFFGSCNQYGKTTSMWQKINQKHDENPFHLALLGGDQIYADNGYYDNAGVFGLEIIRHIMLSDMETRMAPLSKDTTLKVDKDVTDFMLMYYMNHYSKNDFKKFLATVPCKSLAGDHDYFNGKGSYIDFPPVMSRIEEITQRFYLLFQHHTKMKKISESGLIGPSKAGLLLSYNYLLPFETTAFCGLDTRTERTVHQVISPESKDFMFEKLKTVAQKNIFLITEIPLVYQSIRPFYEALSFFNHHPYWKRLYQKNAGFSSEQSNLDIASDCVDQWSYEGHVIERNQLIQWFVKKLVKQMGKKLILLGGDVHSAGASEVIYQSTGETVIWQITSSPITSEVTSSIFVTAKKAISCFQVNEKYNLGLIAKITGYKNFNGKTESKEIALNNWLEIEVSKKEVLPTLWTLPSETSNLERWFPIGWCKNPPAKKESYCNLI